MGTQSVAVRNIRYRHEMRVLVLGDLEGPSQSIAADKVTFGTTRVQRWFDRIWTEDERRPS